MSETLVHKSHPEIVARLKRSHGHLRGVIEMIEAGRPCLEIAQQLHAVDSSCCDRTPINLARPHF